jgi:hypothetical protein
VTPSEGGPDMTEAEEAFVFSSAVEKAVELGFAREKIQKVKWNKIKILT